MFLNNYKQLTRQVPPHYYMESPSLFYVLDWLRWWLWPFTGPYTGAVQSDNH